MRRADYVPKLCHTAQSLGKSKAPNIPTERKTQT